MTIASRLKHRTASASQRRRAAITTPPSPVRGSTPTRPPGARGRAARRRTRSVRCSTGRSRGSSRCRRRAGPARRRHRELPRLRPVEHLADRVRRRAARPRAPGGRVGVDPRTGDGGVVIAARRRWLALAVLCLSLLAIVIDNTIVNVALPTLVRDLDASVSKLQWVVDAYTLVFAALLLLAGALGDRYGRRRTLLAGLAVFAVASLGAAYAGDVQWLIASRAVMGAGAALIMPATLSLLVSIFSDERERALAVGLWAATAGLGVALG